MEDERESFISETKVRRPTEKRIEQDRIGNDI